jgi:hypothetical protein
MLRSDDTFLGEDLSKIQGAIYYDPDSADDIDDDDPDEDLEL